MSQRRIRRALISVSDRTGLLELANALISEGVEIIASDGTANYLKSNSFSVRTVSEITGAPELLGGKVKTLHPIIHAAILADQENPEELRELLSLSPIDAVIVISIQLRGSTLAAQRSFERQQRTPNSSRYSRIRGNIALLSRLYPAARH